MDDTLEDQDEVQFAEFPGGRSPFAVPVQDGSGAPPSAQFGGLEPGSLGPADAELRRLVELARKGEKDVLPRLRMILDTRPELWRHASDLAGCAEGSWIDLIAGRDEYLRESLVRRLSELKADLAGAVPPTALEQLLIDRITVCWLVAFYADASYAQQGQHYSLRQGQYALERQDRAHRRMLSAISALPTLRKALRRGSAAGAGSAPHPGLNSGAGVGDRDRGPVVDQATDAWRIVPLTKGALAPEETLQHAAPADDGARR